MFAVALLGAIAIVWMWQPEIRPNAMVLACWISVVVCAASVNLPRSALARLTPLLAFNTGLCCGAVAATREELPELWLTLPWTLMAVPAIWAVERGAGIAVKVVCSWLLAVALLLAALPFLTVTPGYLPDHLE